MFLPGIVSSQKIITVIILPISTSNTTNIFYTTWTICSAANTIHPVTQTNASDQKPRYVFVNNWQFNIQGLRWPDVASSFLRVLFRDTALRS